MEKKSLTFGSTEDDMIDTKEVRAKAHKLEPYPTGSLLLQCAHEIDRLREDAHMLRLALRTTDAAATLYANQVAHWIEKHDAFKADALRYRWMRDSGAAVFAWTDDTGINWSVSTRDWKVERKQLDEALDRAREALAQKEGPEGP